MMKMSHLSYYENGILKSQYHSKDNFYIDFNKDCVAIFFDKDQAPTSLEIAYSKILEFQVEAQCTSYY